MTKKLDLSKLQFLYSFKIENVDELVIYHFKDLISSVPDKEYVTSSRDVIDNLIGLIRSLPEEGDMYKELSEKRQCIVLYFLGKENNYILEIYETMIRTPDTSLLSIDNSVKDEIIKIVNELLA